jgi:ABC-type siderophore export system fused ATPase/permease subunit
VSLSTPLTRKELQLPTATTLNPILQWIPPTAAWQGQSKSTTRAVTVALVAVLLVMVVERVTEMRTEVVARVVVAAVESRKHKKDARKKTAKTAKERNESLTPSQRQVEHTMTFFSVGLRSIYWLVSSA